MKKATSLLATLVLVFFFTTSALSYDFVLNDGSATYNCTYLCSYQGQDLWSIDVAPQGHGLLFYNTTYGCFTIKVFHDDYWYGYSQEGYWTGCGSTAYNANCGGGLFTVTISCGATSATPEECANSNLKE